MYLLENKLLCTRFTLLCFLCFEVYFRTHLYNRFMSTRSSHTTARCRHSYRLPVPFLLMSDLNKRKRAFPISEKAPVPYHFSSGIFSSSSDGCIFLINIHIKAFIAHDKKAAIVPTCISRPSWRITPHPIT